MAKKKVEMEIEYPDCLVCGGGIFEGEEFIYLGIGQEKYTYKHQPFYRTPAILFGYKIISIHEKCINSPESIKTIFDKIKELRKHGNPDTE